MQRRLTPAERQALYAHKEATIYLVQNGISNFSNRISEMLTHNTTDGLPYVDPELTDEDARQRPWVMVRHNLQREWTGPCILVCVTKDRYSYTAATPNLSETNTWQECRRATPQEIAAAELEVTK
jgi:hypothetical protein